MANEQLFSKRAENYASGRPGYAQGIFALLFQDILKPKDVIADVGSGTGIFAKPLMERGFDVFCLEPNGDMRAQAEKDFGHNPHFMSIAASAEETTLAAQSVDVVVAASAFHWFDAERFRAECQRILKPGGTVFIVFNCRDYRDPFTLRQHALCKEFCKGFTSLRHGFLETAPKLEHFFGEKIQRAEFDFPLEYTKVQFIRRYLSSSYAPEPDTPADEQYVAALEALLEEFAPGGQRITVPNVSVAFWGSLA